MKILVIGLGSMGKRRLRLLKERKDVEIFGVARREEVRELIRNTYRIECYADLKSALISQKFDCAFVCTPPLSHSAIISECLENDMHVFSEINLVGDGYAYNEALAKAKGKVLFISSTFLYRSETKIIIEKCKRHNAKINYIYHVGQYLPDWHPWESYKNIFLRESRTNGCREIMAIELPWLVKAFGDIRSFQVVKGKNTELDIDFNDNYIILFEHKSGAKGVFAVDVISRSPFRHIDIYGEQIQISWDGTPDSLTEFDIEAKKMRTIQLAEQSEHMDGYANFIVENPYREEINAFFSQIHDMANQPVWDFKKDSEILELIDKIETI